MLSSRYIKEENWNLFIFGKSEVKVEEPTAVAKWRIKCLSTAAEERHARRETTFDFDDLDLEYVEYK